jgi:hypothetical protein
MAAVPQPGGSKATPPQAQGWRAIIWPRVLVVVMRILAVVWLVKGLLGWASILGIAIWPGPTFEAELPAQQALTVTFAILDLVAAVGLWLTASWGGVMWIFAVMSSVIAVLLAPAAGGGVVQAAASGMLVAGYLVLSWLAAREPELQS